MSNMAMEYYWNIMAWLFKYDIKRSPHRTL